MSSSTSGASQGLTSNLLQGEGAYFWVLNANPNGPVWCVLLEVPIEDWLRLSTTFIRPRKLFLYALGALYGCEGELYPDEALSGQVDLNDSRAGVFYFNYGDRVPNRIPANLAAPRSSSTHSSSSRQPSVVAQAKARDNLHCVVSGEDLFIEGAHVLPAITTPAEVHHFNHGRGKDKRQLSHAASVENMVTLSMYAHKALDTGRICFITVPNWAIKLEDVVLRDYAYASDAALLSCTDAVLACHVCYCPFAWPALGRFADPVVPAGTKARINVDDDQYPPAWLLDISAGRSVLRTFASSRVEVYFPLEDGKDGGDGRGETNDEATLEGNLSGDALPGAHAADSIRPPSGKHQYATRFNARGAGPSSRQDRLDRLFRQILFRPLTESEKEQEEEVRKEAEELARVLEEKAKLELEERIDKWRICVEHGEGTI